MRYHQLIHWGGSGCDLLTPTFPGLARTLLQETLAAGLTFWPIR
jgi:hypothetical protein